MEMNHLHYSRLMVRSPARLHNTCFSSCIIYVDFELFQVVIDGRPAFDKLSKSFDIVFGDESVFSDCCFITPTGEFRGNPRYPRESGSAWRAHATKEVGFSYVP